MAKLSKDLERIFIFKVLNTKNVGLYDFHKSVLAQMAMVELIFHYDYAPGLRVVLDLEGFTFGHLQKLNPFLMKKVTNIFQVGQK